MIQIIEVSKKTILLQNLFKGSVTLKITVGLHAKVVQKARFLERNKP